MGFLYSYPVKSVMSAKKPDGSYTNIDATAGGMLIVSVSGEIIHGNPQFAEMFQIPDGLMHAHEGQNLFQDKMEIRILISY